MNYHCLLLGKVNEELEIEAKGIFSPYTLSNTTEIINCVNYVYSKMSTISKNLKG